MVCEAWVILQACDVLPEAELNQGDKDMALIEIGQPAPAWNSKDSGGKQVALADFARSPLVLYFYPKDDTSACTKEACEFNDAMSIFATLGGARVVGVSPDSPSSHAKFASKYSLNVMLVADEPVGNVPPICKEFGVWGEKSMYGKTYMGVIRTTYLIDAKGIVARRWDKVKVDGHVEEVKAALAELVGASVPVAKSSATKAKASKPSVKVVSGKVASSKKPASKSARNSTTKPSKKAALKPAPKLTTKPTSKPAPKPIKKPTKT